MGTCDDVNALSILFVFKDTGIVLGCENKEQVFCLTLDKKDEKIQMVKRFLQSIKIQQGLVITIQYNKH